MDRTAQLSARAADLVVAVAYDPAAPPVPADSPASHQPAPAGVPRRQPPPLQASPPETLHLRAAAVLEANWTGASTVPSRGLYPHQWSWDSAFIAIGLRHLSPHRAQTELETLLDAQWGDGRVPHIVFNPSVPLDAYFPSPDFWRSSTAGRAAGAPRTVQTSGIVQPPVHALAAWLVHRADPGLSRARGFLARVYPRLAAWHRYLLHRRDLGGGGLVSVVHPWEQGMDNAPSWDAPLARVVPAPARSFRRADLDHGSAEDRPTDLDYARYVRLATEYRDGGYADGGGEFAVEDPSFNALLIASEHALAHIARELGATGTARHARAQRLTAALVERLWDPAEGMFFCRDLRADAQAGDPERRANRPRNPQPDLDLGLRRDLRPDLDLGLRPDLRPDLDLRPGRERTSHSRAHPHPHSPSGPAPAPDRRADPDPRRADPEPDRRTDPEPDRRADPEPDRRADPEPDRRADPEPRRRPGADGRPGGPDRAPGAGRRGPGGVLVPERGVSGLVPLLLPALPAEVVDGLVQTLRGPHFGVGEVTRLAPSYDLLGEAFDPHRYWRGPAWFNTSWLLERGLRQHGRRAEAEALRRAVLDAAGDSDFAEYVDPYTGEACGATGFSWTAALTLDLVHQDRSGSGTEGGDLG